MELIGPEELRRRLPMVAAIDALEKGFSATLPEVPLRSSVRTPDGQMFLMPAAWTSGAGVKLITVTPGNPERGMPLIQGVYALFAPGSQEPQAVIDGASLTAIRTAAVSGLATRWLARDDARKLVVFGAGVQARSHVEAIRAVRPIEETVIVGRTRAHAEALAREVHGRVGEPEDLSEADVVCTCTTSSAPLFDGSRLQPGTHVNAVGAYTVDARELDTETVVRACVVVETREVATAEAGDLMIPISDGVIGPEHLVADLHELVGGKRVRTSPEDVTLFKSVGMAFEDLVVARAAVG